MQLSAGSSLIAFGAVLTAVSASAGAIVAGFGVVIDLALFYLAGRT